MTQRKMTLIAIGGMVVSLALGVWCGNRYANRKRDEMFNTNEYLSVQHRVKVIEFIYDKEYDKAIKAMESRLNVEILVLGPNPYDKRPLDDHSRSALQLAAQHRAKYPFATDSPGTNQMIQDALKSAQ